MKPFKAKPRMNKKRLLRRRIFAVIVMTLLAMAWYKAADKINVNQNDKQILKEGTEYGK